MAHLYRLIVAVLLAWLTVPAMADGGPFPAAVTYDYRGVSYSTASAACAGYIAYVQPLNPGNTYSVGGITEYASNAICKVNASNGSASWVDNVSVGRSVSACPAGAHTTTGSGGQTLCTCTEGLRPKDAKCVALPACPDGQHEEGGACVPNNCTGEQTRVNGICVDPPPCPAGQVRVAGKCKVPDKCPKPGESAGEYRVKNTTPTAFCEAGCVVDVRLFFRGIKDGKVVETIGLGTYTGAECSGPSNPPDSDGGNGDGGGDDGGDGGDDGGGDDGGGDGGTGPGPGGGGTGPGTGPGGNNNDPDKPEKCPNGKCSGDGEGGGDEGGPTNPDPGTGSCPSGTYKANGKCWPNEPRPPRPPDNDGRCPAGYIKVGSQCIELRPDEEDDDEDDKPGIFSGSCGGFSCEGDAIQCAIAKEQHIKNCKLFEDKSAESDLYNAMKGKTGNQTGDLPGNEVISITGRIDTSDALGGGGCFGDLNVTVWNTSVSLPLSNLCQYLAMLGNILVAVSMLMAARIVTRG